MFYENSIKGFDLVALATIDTIRGYNLVYQVKRL
jgi:hypothetical protein